MLRPNGPLKRMYPELSLPDLRSLAISGELQNIEFWNDEKYLRCQYVSALASHLLVTSCGCFCLSGIVCMLSSALAESGPAYSY